jgi:hypothetical protein
MPNLAQRSTTDGMLIEYLDVLAKKVLLGQIVIKRNVLGAMIPQHLVWTKRS